MLNMSIYLKRPSGLCLHILLLILVPLHCLPTIEQTNTQQSGNYVTHSLDKTPFISQPELEDTIEEVQKILAQDPSLPRLTRGEIEELYEKVTREEYERSLKAGDISRADSMRALMLVLPYNTDNNTEENLQEIYARPPVTKVIDNYTPSKPTQYISTDSTWDSKDETITTDVIEPSTNKPTIKYSSTISTTTFLPPIPMKFFKKNMPPTFVEPMTGFRPITTAMPVYNYAWNAAHVAQTIKPNQRFSSQYSAKNADFLKPPRPRSTTTTTTIRPMADILESYGIVGKLQLRKQAMMDDFVPAESAPQGVISSYVPQAVNVAQLQNLYAQQYSPRITPEAYTNFKPLNIGEEIRVKPEIERYLTRFGIVANRKRKELNEDTNNEDTDLYKTKVLNGSKRARKGVENKSNGNTELDKLIENLKELERLNVNPKMLTTTSSSTSTTTTTTTSTTTTSTPPPITTVKTRTTTMRDLITNGAPMLIEPMKPMRRIDPNVGLNSGLANNKRSGQPKNDDQLEKLLENLQELQKLQINPENVLKSVVTTTKKPTSTTTTKKPNTTSIAEQQQQQLKLQRQVEAQQLEEVLKQIQAAEKRRITTTTTTTTTTTKKPRPNTSALGLSQLRRLLTDDNELERLYNEARERAGGKPTKTITTTTTPATTTTKQPAIDVAELQRYLALLDKPTTTTTSTSSTTTTTTTPRPKSTTTTTEATVKKPTLQNDQIFELINRVQELERAQAQKSTLPTSSNLPFLGFTSRNVNTPTTLDSNKLYRSSNDFAQLQQLYQKVQNAEQNSFAGVEISTAATATKSQNNRSKSQDFAQRIIDITNDTGSGSSLQQVGPNEFVHLQKLLNKVQELERVRIGPNGVIQSMSTTPAFKTQRDVPTKSMLTTVESGTVNVYAVPAKISDADFDKNDNEQDLKLDLPVYQKPIKTKPLAKNKSTDLTSSEELREFVMSAPANPKQTTTDADFERYQELFASLEDPERNAYQNLQPPIIQKTVTKEPPRFVATRKPQELPKTTKSPQQGDLKELQKLLSNAQELEKLGVTLPAQFSKDIESKLTQTINLNVKEGFKKIQIPTSQTKTKPSSEVDHYLEKYGIINSKEDFSKLSTASNEITTNGKELADVYKGDSAFISLTTIRPSTPMEPKTTTESAVQLPVFSATKIIEAAIKRAATKIGVSTENTLGFRRRSDTDVMDMNSDDDLMAEFSELNYQIASPNAPAPFSAVTEKSEEATASNTKNESLEISKDLDELQRLIKNLKELQALNISSSAQALRVADAAYLETLKKSQAVSDNNNLVAKNRRQSETNTASTIESFLNDVSSPTTPTRVSLDLNLDDSDVQTAEKESDTSTSTTVKSTTEESRNGAITDLEDSFGPDPNAEAEQPPKKKNGFYFLADWNSFLEVGDGDDQVVVRFSPKIGDPRLFIPVKVP